MFYSIEFYSNWLSLALWKASFGDLIDFKFRVEGLYLMIWQFDWKEYILLLCDFSFENS